MIKPIVIYDEDCGICTHISRWARRKTDRIEFLGFYEFTDKSELDDIKDLKELSLRTIILISATGQKIFIESEAVLVILKYMGGFWRIIGEIFHHKPGIAVLNLFYRIIARNRAKISRIFGLNACKVR